MVNKMKHKPVVCILDNDKARCLREEDALDRAIADKKMPVLGAANFGPAHLERTGLTRFPAIDVDGVYFEFKNAGEELTYEILCDFLDMLVRRGVIKTNPSE